MGSNVGVDADADPEAQRAITTQILDHTHSLIRSMQMAPGLVGQRSPESGVVQRFAEFQRDRILVTQRVLEDLYEVTGFDEIDSPPPMQPNMEQTETVPHAPSSKWEVTPFEGFDSHKANQLPEVDAAVYIVRPGKPHKFGGVKALRMLRELDPECKKIIAMIKPFDLIDTRRRQANPYDEFYEVPGGFVGQEIDEEYLIKNNFKGVFLLHSGTAFKGQLRQLQRCGYGELVTNEGEFRQGTFTHRGLNGLGRVVTVKRVVFQGNFIDDLPCGSGAMLDMEKSIKYDGKFKNGVPHGKGRIFYRDPDYSPDECASYEGDFYEGELTGYGKKIFINGDTYEGYVEKGLPQGRAKVYCARTNTTSVASFEKGRLVSKLDTK